MRIKTITGILATVSCFYANSQSLKSVVTLKDKPAEVVSVLKGDKLDSDAFKFDIFLTADKATLETISLYSIKENYYINGTKVDLNLWTRYKMSNDLKGKSALKTSMEVEDIIENVADLVKETDNTFKIEFLNEKQADALMSSAEIKFNIPGFNESSSDFCGKMFEKKSSDPKVEAMLHTIFKTVYPHTEIVETVMNREWNISSSMGGSNSYMIIFKNKGKLWSLKYAASYAVEDGKVMSTPRVKIYNGLDDPKPLAESCLKSLQSKLK